jgi:hypothetical protein
MSALVIPRLVIDNTMGAQLVGVFLAAILYGGICVSLVLPSDRSLITSSLLHSNLALLWVVHEGSLGTSRPGTSAFTSSQPNARIPLIFSACPQVAVCFACDTIHQMLITHTSKCHKVACFVPGRTLTVSFRAVTILCSLHLSREEL